MIRSKLYAKTISFGRILQAPANCCSLFSINGNGNATASQLFRNGNFYFREINTGTHHTNGGNNQNEHSHSFNGNSKSGAFLGVVGGLSLFGFVAWKKLQTEHGTLHAATLSSSSSQNCSEPEELKPNLPTFKSSQVAEHYNAEKKIWVSFRRGVYDITDFVNKHPGGSARIMMAAGGSLEPFWELYPVHQKQEVFEILGKYRIGNLAEDDIADVKDATDHFKHDPKRHPALIRRSEKPFNGETPPALLPEQFYTPNDIFYVRNHLPVPEIDVKSYRLEIEGIKIKGKSLTLQDVKKFPKVCISATIQCGGNRRSDMSKTKQTAGLNWSGGAIGNAKWSGARLRDVLKHAGFDPNSYPHPEKIHVQFEGLDSDQSGECYGASIPLSFFLDANFEPILAYEMNDKEIPLDHGFPLRIVLPGIVGARSVKWLSKIVVSDQESQSPWQQRDYKVFSPGTTLETVDYSSAPAIMDTPVTSYICSHQDGDEVKKGIVKFQGYAFSGNGRGIVRVEISKDQGITWEVAKIKSKASDGPRNWSWVLWEADLPISPKDREVWVKAVDTGYNQQPEDFKNVWNYRGLLSTAYHKIRFNVK